MREFIKSYRTEISVGQIVEVLGDRHRGYGVWFCRNLSTRTVWDKRILARIFGIHTENQGRDSIVHIRVTPIYPQAAELTTRDRQHLFISLHSFSHLGDCGGHLYQQMLGWKFGIRHDAAVELGTLRMVAKEQSTRSVIRHSKQDLQ